MPPCVGFLADREKISYCATGPHAVSNRHKYAPKETAIPEQIRVRIDFVELGKEAVPELF
jgi:hypothetical protein